MSRPTVAEIRIAALKHNCSVIKQHHGGKVLGVVKANAYGHGLVDCAKALDVDGLAVACIEEAVHLREGGVRAPIVLLEGVFDPKELTLVGRHELDIVIHREEQVTWLEQASLLLPLRVWLKFNTGMHRLGFSIDQLEAMNARLQACSSVKQVVLMSHLACADDPESPMTDQQLAVFSSATEAYECERSLANSAASLAWPKTHFDWVRPGIALYGSTPVLDKSAAQLGLQPVMTLKSQIIGIQSCKAGDSVGYGADFRATKDMLVGTVAIGYADGYPRHAPSGTPVMVDGVECKLIGRVSMDMISVDLSPIANPIEGMGVELWGENLSVDTVAQHANTISYELLTQINQRVPRRYI